MGRAVQFVRVSDQARHPDAGAVEHLAEELPVVVDRFVVGEEHLEIAEHVDEDESEENHAGDRHDDLASNGGTHELFGPCHGDRDGHRAGG
jgi:hypothetical protein